MVNKSRWKELKELIGKWSLPISAGFTVIVVLLFILATLCDIFLVFLLAVPLMAAFLGGMMCLAFSGRLG